MGGGAQDVVKFFVTNLPEGCTPWELRKGLEGFGVISGTYVAKKRDKLGNRFGFVSFIEVKDRAALEKVLSGVKLGDSKLKVNLARFALENSGSVAQQEPRKYGPGAPVQAEKGAAFKSRDGRSFRDVLGGSSYPSDSSKGGVSVASGKLVIVPDRLSAFNDLVGLAVVGRCVDLETLVDLDKLLRIAKVPFAKIQYLGGLSIIISFSDGDAMEGFLKARVIWGPWFFKLEGWKGQSLPLERVAWLNLHGIPLHLLDKEVLALIGEKYGKVLHIPTAFEDSRDLSVVSVGVLVGEAGRIGEMVSLAWKGRNFRLWVEEETEAWVPDCLNGDTDVVSDSESDSPLKSSPVGIVDVDGFHPVGSQGGEEESPGLDVSNSNAFVGNMAEDRGKEGGAGWSEGGPNNVPPGRAPVGPDSDDAVVGPNPNPFAMGRGVKSGRRTDKGMLGSRLRKARTQQAKVSSPVDTRPLKRPRPEAVASEPGFDFSGFCSSAAPEEGGIFSSKVGNDGGFDLNLRAASDASENGSAPPRLGEIGEAFISPKEASGVFLEKEVSSTFAVGERLGVDLSGHPELVKEAVSITGGDLKPGWIKSIKQEYGINFMAFQESKQCNVSRAVLAKYWGSGNYAFVAIDSNGLSGGLISMWDVSMFSVDETVENRNYLLVRGRMLGYDAPVNILNVYAPQGVAAKKEVWDSIASLINIYDGYWVVGGDFNAVRFREEKRNCSFKHLCASNFNSFIYETGLIEYDMRGRNFTWQSENGYKLSKLDRFLVNIEFFNKWPEARVQVLPRMWSDHNPIVLSIKSVNFGARPFRVFNSWLGKEGFNEVVVDACGAFSAEGIPPDLFFIQKLGYIRSKIQAWRNNMIKKEGEALDSAKEEVAEIEAILESRDLTEDEEWILAENKKVIAEIEQAKTMDLKQRSRVQWAKEGDENSKLFHTYINCRKASNVIHGLNIGGEWVSKPTLVKKEVFKFFKSKFVEDCVSRPVLPCHNLKKISGAEADRVEGPFTAEEIKAAVFECGDDRSPGPDGFNFRFFKHFWNLFEDDVFNIMAAFFVSGKVNLGCGSSFIALIPKKRDPVGLSDYRPISLVGVVNKVISKVLANRLKRVLGSVISDSQSAFLGGRFIMDGPLIINEVCSWIKKGKKKAFLLKIDFEKAYDNINWGFVIDVLRQMGFGPRWCNWVWGVLSSARASVLVNGSPTFEFKCDKGMRQGDPLSPFLFVVAMEALSCLLNKAREVGVVSGISLPNDGPHLSHLFFADDALILGKWDASNALNIVRVLRCFYACSGLRINLGKSNLYGIGVSDSELGAMADVVGCTPDSLPFRYLGLKVGANMNRLSN
ncbi:putative RNA-directed DNA polymerase [Helianthus annuus]|nr:putative RNA-directed DNA polymerase [Helianthus annuus]